MKRRLPMLALCLGALPAVSPGDSLLENFGVVLDGAATGAGGHMGTVVIGGGATGVIRGSGVRVAARRTLDPFGHLVSRVAAEVQVVCGREPAVEISGDDNIVPLIGSRVDAGVLTLSSDASYDPGEPLRITVFVPELQSLVQEGSGSMQLSGVDGERLNILLRGAGDVTAQGEVWRLEAELGGAGDLRLQDLRARSVNITLSGAGDGYVQAEESLTGRILGAGDVHYAGNPGKRDLQALGAGKFKAMNQGMFAPGDRVKREFLR